MANSWRAGHQRRVYVPEDAPSLDLTNNPCTNELSEPLPLCSIRKNFSYTSYTEFHRMKAFLEEAKGRLEEFKNGQGESSSTTDLPDVELSDEKLKMEFFAKYGPVDFNHPTMANYIKIMRETKLEAQSKVKSRSKITDEAFFDRCFEWGIEHPEVSYHCVEEIEKKFNGAFNSEEKLMYSKLSPSESKGEWFRLPRPESADLTERGDTMATRHHTVTTEQLNRLRENHSREEAPCSETVLDPQLGTSSRPPPGFYCDSVGSYVVLPD